MESPKKGKQGERRTISPYAFPGLSASSQERVRWNKPPVQYKLNKRGTFNYYNKHPDFETVGYKHLVRYELRQYKKEQWMNKVLEFIIIYLDNGYTKENFFSKKKTNFNISGRILFSYVTMMKEHPVLKLTDASKFMGKDHASVIHLRNTQQGYNEMYLKEKAKCDYIMSFVNMPVGDVLEFEFNETNKIIIKDKKFQEYVNSN